MADKKRPFTDTKQENDKTDWRQTKDTKDTDEIAVDDSTKVSENPTQPVKKVRHSKAFSFVSMLFLLSLLAVGVFAYLWYDVKMDNASLKSAVSQSESQNSIGGGEKDDNGVPIDAKAEAIRAAENYVCIESGEICKKLNEILTVKRISDFNVEDRQTSGFALVNFKSNNVTKIWLKTSDAGQTWAVIYDGIAEPPASIVRKYGIPDSFVYGRD